MKKPVKRINVTSKAQPRIRVTSKMPPRIRVTSKAQPRIDPEFVAEALGAEIVGTRRHDIWANPAPPSSSPFAKLKPPSKAAMKKAVKKATSKKAKADLAKQLEPYQERPKKYEVLVQSGRTSFADALPNNPPRSGKEHMVQGKPKRKKLTWSQRHAKLPQEEQVRWMLVCLEKLAAMNLTYLKAHKKTPSLRKSGVTYDGHSLLRETYSDIPAVLKRGTADTGDIVAWRVAELRARGIKAAVFIKHPVACPWGNYYAVGVRFPNGKVEYPMKMLRKVEKPLCL